MLADE